MQITSKSVYKLSLSLLGVVTLLLLPNNYTTDASINGINIRNTCTTYYVSNSGNDQNTGTSTSSAWKTLGKVNNIDLEPCDKILLKGGDRFYTPLSLTDEDKGTSTQPITISSYGEGKAKIKSLENTAISLTNVEYVDINNLVLHGSGISSNNGHGLLVYNQSGSKLSSIKIENLDIYGFNLGGITIGENDGASGFSNINIEKSNVHHNGSHGIQVFGQFLGDSNPSYSHDKITIRNNIVHTNKGERGVTTKHTGNGILVGQSKHVLIANNKAYNNGGNSKHRTAGPCGIWAWESSHVKIQLNHSFANKTGGNTDGCGFNLDGGVSNSTMQYNYSFNNYGAGFQLSQFTGASPNYNNIIRYNISENDSRKNNTYSLQLWRGAGAMNNIKIYNNTISRTGTKVKTAGLIGSISNSINGVDIFNNIFTADESSNLAYLKSSDGLEFTNNNFTALDGEFKILQGNSLHTTISSWRSKNMNINKNYRYKPKFQEGSGASAFRLSSDSKLINKGVKNTLPTRDFFNNSIPKGNSTDIGAHEFQE